MNQWTLMIVEDEYWIRYKLVNHDWARLGVGRILEAANGEEAVSILERERVDVILTDMDMPYMDGGTLIAWVKEHRPEIFTLVLSGYSDFAMVRSAMVGGAVDYLLKPVREAELYAAMEKILARVEARRAEQGRAEGVRLQARDLQMSRCLRADGDDADLSGLLPERFRIVDVRVKGVNHQDQPAREAEIRSMVASALKIPVEWAFMNVNVRHECVAVVPADADAVGGAEELRGRLAQTGWVQRSMIAPGGVIQGASGFRRGYRALEEALTSAIMLPEAHWIVDGSRPAERQVVPRLNEGFAGRLERAVRRGNAEAAAEEIEAFFDLKRIIAERWMYYEFASAARHCSRLIVDSCERRGASMDVLSALRTFRDIIDGEIRQFGMADIPNLLAQMARASEQETEEEGGESLPGRIQAYVDENYAEPLTLGSIAEAFHVSVSYLSRSFKKQTGKNMVSYVADKRMEAARRLLEAGEHTISEVAFQVGYEDYSYFSNIFRRLNGMSPREYQKQHSVQE